MAKEEQEQHEVPDTGKYLLAAFKYDVDLGEFYEEFLSDEPLTAEEAEISAKEHFSLMERNGEELVKYRLDVVERYQMRVERTVQRVRKNEPQ